jgi:hypothetical protein
MIEQLKTLAIAAFAIVGAGLFVFFIAVPLFVGLVLTLGLIATVAIAFLFFFWVISMVEMLGQPKATS